MKKIACFSLLSATLFGTTLSGALPPLAQSIREMKAVLQDERLYQMLESGDWIESIAYEENSYLILTAKKRRLRAEVTYLPVEQLGPVHFALSFEELF